MKTTVNNNKIKDIEEGEGAYMHLVDGMDTVHMDAYG